MHEITEQQRQQARRRLELIAAGRALIATGASPTALLGELHTLGASREDVHAVASRVLGWSEDDAVVAVSAHPDWQVPVPQQLGDVPWTPQVVDSPPGAGLLRLRRFNALSFAIAVLCGLLGFQIPALFLVVVAAMLLLPFASAFLIAAEVRAMRRDGDAAGHITGLLLGIAILTITGGLWMTVVWFLS